MSVKEAARKAARAAMPWWAKGALKIALAHVPLSYPVLRSMSLARHGGMEDPAWAWQTFTRHFNRADFPRIGAGFSILEMGPGDSLFTAVIARALGAENCRLVDVAPYATNDVRLYQRMAEFLRDRGWRPPDLSGAKSVEDVLAACGARYATEGIDSLRRLPDQSFDFIFSNVVIQCIRRVELPDTLAQLRRLLRPGGSCVHSIDLRDMMGQSLHHLRFCEEAWESDWVRRSGFYTNRYRLSELIELNRGAGFDTELDEVNRWPRLPLPRATLAQPYRQMPEGELRVATVRLILRPR